MDGGAETELTVTIATSRLFYDTADEVLTCPVACSHDSITTTFPTDDEYIWCNKTEFSKEHIQKGTTIYFW